MNKRTIELKNKYDSKIYLNEDKKEIYKLTCECPDFKFRRIKQVGDFAEKRFYAEPCKHLRKIFDSLIKIKYILKKPSLDGTDKPTAELKRKLIERARGICESNNCNNNPSKIHRKIRGSSGGKYSEENCVFICTKCHNMRHSNEFSGSKSK